METTSKFIDNDLSQKMFGKNILNKILYSNDLDIEMEENISNFLDHQDPSVIVIDLEFLNFYNDPHLELSNTNNILNSLIQKGLKNVNSKVIFLLSENPYKLKETIRFMENNLGKISIVSEALQELKEISNKETRTYTQLVYDSFNQMKDSQAINNLLKRLYYLDEYPKHFNFRISELDTYTKEIMEKHLHIKTILDLRVFLNHGNMFDFMNNNKTNKQAHNNFKFMEDFIGNDKIKNQFQNKLKILNNRYRNNKYNLNHIPNLNSILLGPNGIGIEYFANEFANNLINLFPSKFTNTETINLTSIKSHQYIDNIIDIIKNLRDTILIVNKAENLYDEISIIAEILSVTLDTTRNNVLVLCGQRHETTKLLDEIKELKSLFKETDIYNFENLNNHELHLVLNNYLENEGYSLDQDTLRYTESFFSDQLTVKDENFLNRIFVSDFASTLIDKSSIINQHEKTIDIELIQQVISRYINDESVSIEEARRNLERFMSVNTYKDIVDNIDNHIKHRRNEALRNSKREIVDLKFNYFLIGNPGIGKTQFTKSLASYLKANGLLKQGNILEKKPSDFIGKYKGESAIKTENILNEARGGIIFIDEVYGFATSTNKDGASDGYEDGAVNVINAHMTEDNPAHIIAAGYKKDIEKFKNMNPGLPSRFIDYYIEDYKPDYLVEIFKYLLNQSQYTADENIFEVLHEFFTILYDNRDEDFANARMVENLYKSVYDKYIARIVKDETSRIDHFITDDLINSHYYEQEMTKYRNNNKQL